MKLIPAAKHEGGAGTLEMSDMGDNKRYRDDPDQFDDELDDFNYRPAVRRQNWCFVSGFCCFAVAAILFLAAGADLLVGSSSENTNSDAAENVSSSPLTWEKVKSKWQNGEPVVKGHSWPWNKKHHPYGPKKNSSRSFPSPLVDDPPLVDVDGMDSWWVQPKSHDAVVSLSDGIKYEILEEMQHDKKTFTQGLTYGNGLLYESAGLYGQSKIRQLDPKTGAVLKSVDMARKYFAEGMTYYDDDRLIQITWKAQTGFIYRASTLEQLSQFTFTTTLNEGWGITFDPRDRTLIVSDGSAFLHFWSPDAIEATGKAEDVKPRVKVTRQDPSQSAEELNELEFVNGRVIANVWYKDILLVINPETGECEDEYDFKDLWPKKERTLDRADVLNGVSVSDEDGVLYVTGKKWKKMFRLKLLF